MSFDLFGPATKCDIQVGYISTDRGLVEGISLYEANQEAKLNPGTQFIFRNRDKVEYLNINEVNNLTPEMMLPSKMSANDNCSGIVGLNLEGDTSKSIDDAFNLTTPIVGGTTKDGASDARDKTAVDFYGGGGVGVQAAPIIGIDGSVLAVQVIHGGYGYQYPPIVDISDDTGQGSGVVAQAFIKTRSSDDKVLIEEFDTEEDYEEYDLETCAPEIEKIGYGQRWSPDGKDLGKWDPSVYFNKSKDPIRYEIEQYQKFLLSLKGGTRIVNNRILEWWTTRKKAPLRITSPDKVTREKFDVQHFAWGGIKSNSSPTLPLTSGGDSSKSTDFIESSFRVYTSGGRGRDLKFIFTSTVGNHSFEIKADDYKDNASAEEIKIKVKRNVKYKVVTTSRKGIRDQGLLRKGTFGTGGDIAKRSGTSDAIFSDIAKTAPDDDDLQVQCKLGTFTNDNGNIIFEFKDNSAYNVLSIANKDVAVAKSKVTKDSFMNQFAISPIPPSNVPGSDNAGKIYTFEWEEEFPYEGDYIFNVQCDNDAYLFIDNDPVSDDFHIGKGGAAGHILSGPSSIKKYMKAGIARITLDLLNHQIKEKKKIRTNLGEVTESTNVATFKVSSNSDNANRIEMEGVFEFSKERKGVQINETVTKPLEYGKVYNVKVTGRKLKLKGERVLAMEDSSDADYNDIECSTTLGKFYDISGTTCKFSIPTPPPLPKQDSTIKQEGNRAKVFNTIDFINKANRKLWKINPSVVRDGNFLNQFGVLPFNPAAVADVKKNTEKSIVKFEVGDNGKTYLNVSGSGRVKVGLRLNVNDNPRRAGLAVREVKIQADDGEIFMKREWVTRATDRGIGVFTAGKKYEVKILGGVGRTPIPNNAQDTIGLLDGHGTDWNADVKITSVNQVSPINASTDAYAGFHEIVWNNITFPEDGNYAISTMVDDNVTLTFSGKSSSANVKDVVLFKEGYRIRGDGSTGKGKSVEIKYFKSGTYTLNAVLEQIQGNPLANGNPMALAVDVKAAFVTNEIEVVSNKSWNENPMGVAMTIDAPMAPTPKEPPQIQEGRCPNNPIWTTRSTKDVDQVWYPVRVDAWSKFTNRYGLSPLPPLGFKGTDGAGTVWRNTWRVPLPYKGFYGVKGTVDNFGKLFIDGVEVLGSNSDKKLESFKTNSPKAKKIFLEQKTVEITVEVENAQQYIYNTIDKKIFSTADWAFKQTQTTTEGPKNIDVTFKVSSSADNANRITMNDVFEFSKVRKGPQINETVTKNLEYGKVYTLNLTGRKLKTKGEQVLAMEDSSDEDYNDLLCSSTIGKFYDISGTTCKFIIPKEATEVKYGEGLVSGSVKDGVSYAGPPLATYATGTLGAFITPAFKNDEDYIANFNGKTWTMTFSGVDFPESGTYDIQAEADDLLIIKIDGTEVAKAEVGNGITKSQFNVTEGKRTVELTLTNIQLNLPFSSNPTVAGVKITKKTQVAKVDPRTGTAQGKPWTVNPLGISAILIPPPCPKKINGVGIVTSVIITDPGNGFPTDPTPPPGTPPAGPPVILELDEIIGEPGINYGPDDQVCVINTETGEEICFTPPKTPTTGIGPFKPTIDDGGDGGSGGSGGKPNGYRTYPEIRVRSGTGIGYRGIPILKPVIDPIGVEPDRLIQVTDLPGLKQTGYYDGKPYYGAVFYEDGVRFAGYYDTPGQKVQIYDTLQESIDAEVTTPPSAIQRQGTDINSNNPRLNIPGTPDNLT